MDTQTAHRQSAPHGLSLAQVQAARKAGNTNYIKTDTWKLYREIFKENIFNFYNFVPTIIGISLFVVGLRADAIVSVGTIGFNILVGLYEELRAAYRLNKINILMRPKVRVVRNGKVQIMDPNKIVLGDIIKLEPGDQVVVDGPIVYGSTLEVDESMLTGESDTVEKNTGDTLLSGSYAVSGVVYYEAQQVGRNSYAFQLANKAKKFRRTYTPLQRQIGILIRSLLLVVAYFVILISFTAFKNGLSIGSVLQQLAVTAGLIPNGLIVMISLAYALGAVRISSKGAIVQKANSIEAISNIEVLCLDKTGTITANRLAVEDYFSLNKSVDFATHLSNVVASTNAQNKTSEAILAHTPGKPLTVINEIPFSSARKWSALETNDAVYVLGAPEILFKKNELDSAASTFLDSATDKGLRVLALAKSQTKLDIDAKSLPDSLELIGLVSMSDQLRPSARATLDTLRQAGIELKIISGDSVNTVTALARQVGFEEIFALSGPQVEEMNDETLESAVRVTNIFGRIQPEQKQRIIRAIRRGNKFVSMTGDGINDVLSLKEANVGISMESATQAAKNSAHLILLKDNFDILPQAILEGQRIRNAMQDNLKLHLPRVLFELFLIMSVAIMSLGFPFLPRQSSFMVLLTVGIPVVFVTIWASNDGGIKRNIVKSILGFVITATVTRLLLTLSVYAFFFLDTFGNIQQRLNNLLSSNPLSQDQISSQALAAATDQARTAVFIVSVVSGLLLITFLKPPVKWLGVVEKFDTQNWKFFWPVLACVVLLIVGLILPWGRETLGVVNLSFAQYTIVTGSILLWSSISWVLWKYKVFDRFLNVR